MNRFDKFIGSGQITCLSGEKIVNPAIRKRVDPKNVRYAPTKKNTGPSNANRRHASYGGIGFLSKQQQQKRR